MNDLPSSLALQQNNAKPKTGEELEVLGKEAATQFLRGNYGSLTDAVVGTVKTSGLSPEQVRRVVEFTNVDAFNQEFKKEGSGHKVVQFEGGPADYPEVLRELNDGSGGTVFDKHAHDYSTPPPNMSLLALQDEDKLGVENEKLAAAFGVEGYQLPFADPLREALDTKDKLARAEEDLATELTHLEGQYLDIVDSLNQEVKQACLGGIELGQVVQAWSTVTSKPEFMKAAFAQLTPRLLKGEVYPSKEAIGESLLKTASAGMVNPEHPLVVRFQDFCETLTKMAETRVAHAGVGEQIDRLGTFLKAAAAPGELAGAVKGTWEAAKSMSQKAAPLVGKTIRGVGGAAGDIAEVAIPWVPEAALAGGAYKAHDMAQRSPRVQRALSYVPGTKQQKIRQYYERQR
jgi:hypothetical protein